jgi:hypothetical protein
MGTWNWTLPAPTIPHAKSRQPVRSNFQGLGRPAIGRGITSLGIAAKQRNALFQLIKMGL